MLEFFNMSVSEFFVSVVVYEKNYFGRIFGPGGLVVNLNYLFLFHAFLPSLM